MINSSDKASKSFLPRCQRDVCHADKRHARVGSRAHSAATLREIFSSHALIDLAYGFSRTKDVFDNALLNKEKALSRHTLVVKCERTIAAGECSVSHNIYRVGTELVR